MRIAYTALHYGAEYLAWALRSIQDAVDQIHVLYTPTPSYGYVADVPCHETEEQLHAEAKRFTSIPVVWHRGQHNQWRSEASHRDSIYKIADDLGASQVLVVDADEVWLPGAAREALDYAERSFCGRLGVPFQHFWQSFSWMCRDPWMPIRVLNMKKPDQGEMFASVLPRVQHFGYAQSVRLVEFKWRIHGHRVELRNNWLQDKFMLWPPGKDVHPTTFGMWYPEPYERDRLAPILNDHPYFNLEDPIP